VTVDDLNALREEPLVTHRVDEETAERIARTLLDAYTDID
jgi:hypothetical protein